MAPNIPDPRTATVTEMHKLFDDRKVDSLLKLNPIFYSKNIKIEYHVFLDWMEHTDVIRNHGALREKVDRYTLLKGGYERSISHKLDKFQTFATSKIVMDQIGRASHSLKITPEDWDKTLGAETSAEGDPTGAAETAKGMPVRTYKGNPTGVIGTGTGADIQIKISPDEIVSLNIGRKVPGYSPLFVLFHEIVHAMFDLDGKNERFPIRTNFVNEMEFLAVVITDMLMPEAGESKLLGSYAPLLPMQDPDNFINMNLEPPPRALFRRLRKLEPKVFWDLAHLPPHRPGFNPIRQFNDEQTSSP
jgi:hypothetical protein